MITVPRKKMNAKNFGILLLMSEIIQDIVMNKKYKYSEKKAQKIIIKAVSEIEKIAFGNTNLSDFDKYQEMILSEHLKDMPDKYIIKICSFIIDRILHERQDFNLNMKQYFVIISRYSSMLTKSVVTISQIDQFYNYLSDFFNLKFQTNDN